MTPLLLLRHPNRTRTHIPLVFVLALAVLVPAASSRAEGGDNAGDDPAAASAVVVITGRKPGDGEAASCAKSAPSGAVDYACLNGRLALMRRQTDPLPAHPSVEDIIGHGEPNRVGTFSYSGTRQQFGSSFGVSVTPQRPPPATYTPSIRPLNPGH